MSDFFPFHRPTIYPSHVKAVSEAVASGWLTQGQKVLEFETAFAKVVGGKHAVAVNSCTAALHLALLALGVRPGHQVITSPITFVSAVNVIEHVGATPLFVDVREDDLTLDPYKMVVALERKHPEDGPIRAIIATHFAGYPGDIDILEVLAQEHGIPLITDAAHGIETSFYGRPSGQLGRVACYSFYATKNITTGEGGMLVTDDAEIADQARHLRLHGMTRDAWRRYGEAGYKHWDCTAPGYKYNMGDMQAALGLAQLDDMPEWHARRRALDTCYRQRLPKAAKPLAAAPEGVTPAYHLEVVRVPKRDALMDAIQRRGIGVGVHFRAVHQLAYYQEKYRLPAGSLPVAEKASNEVLSLPLYPSMADTDVITVVNTMIAAATEG